MRKAASRSISAVVANAAGEGVKLTGLRALLVEDNEINQQIAVELLEGVGAKVDVANNGQEAVDRLVKGPIPPPYDVVLMDLQMPVLDGHQATAKIRADARFAPPGSTASRASLRSTTTSGPGVASSGAASTTPRGRLIVANAAAAHTTATSARRVRSVRCIRPSVPDRFRPHTLSQFPAFTHPAARSL